MNVISQSCSRVKVNLISKTFAVILHSQIYLSNRKMGSIINTLTKIPALWIAQSKETFLPQFVYNFCKEYMSSEND